MSRSRGCAIHRAAKWPIISQRARSWRSCRFGSRASCCSPRAPRWAAVPTWLRPPIRWRRSSGWTQQPRLHVEQCSGKAMGVGDDFARDRDWSWMCRSDLANRAAEIEPQLRIELAGELLHTFVVGETRHMQKRDAAIAGREQGACEQRGANAVTLPRLFDTEGRFRLARDRRTDRAQFGSATHCPVHEESVNNGVNIRGQCGVLVQEFIRDGAAEAIAPTDRIKPQQVLAITASFDRPHLANDATFGKGLAHRTPSRTRSS